MLRIGYGYDVHGLKSGRRFVLGGVEIPFERGLEGHSDADVLCHAIADAILGASAMGDIGSHFPDTDPGLKGISSILILRKVAGMSAANGFRTLRVRLIEPRSQAPYGGNGISPQGLVAEIVSRYRRLFISLMRSMNSTPGSAQS